MARHDNILVSRTLYQISIITLITAIAWVGIGIYQTMTKTTTLEIDKSLLAPIKVGIDLEVVKQLSGRLKIEEIMTPPESSTSAQENVIIDESTIR